MSNVQTTVIMNNVLSVNGTTINYQLDINTVIERYNLHETGISDVEEKHGLEYQILEYLPKDLFSGKSHKQTLRLNQGSHKMLSDILLTLRADQKQRALLPSLFEAHIITYNVRFDCLFATCTSTGYTDRKGNKIAAGSPILDLLTGKPKLRQNVDGLKFPLPSAFFKPMEEIEIKAHIRGEDDVVVEKQIMMPVESKAVLLEKYEDDEKFVEALTPLINGSARTLIESMVSQGLWQFQS
jgi:hypothetical protein